MNSPLGPDRGTAGSPLYDISPDHIVALVALGALVIIARLLGRAHRPAGAPIDSLLVALLAGSAAIHVGIAVGHDGQSPALRLLFLIDAALLLWSARRVARGARPGRVAAATLTASILAYWASALGSDPPDQLGIATKLGEILALAIVVRVPRMGSRSAVRSAAGSAAIALLVIGTAASGWIGAFRASAAEPGVKAGQHVHGGSVPPPGTVISPAPDREPTPAERAAAAEMVVAARAALARYADPAAAAADGYRVHGLSGIDFHAQNEVYERDGRIMDPARPEGLVYAVAPDGRPVLMGAVFSMPRVAAPGPAVGGPLTVWHAHENVCVSPIPPALTGLLSPLGMCPIGSIAVPLTPEMIHLWTVPGAPDPFGDLDAEWRRAYLQELVARP